LSVGVFGTLGMHSPKVPHPDFSVKVMRHNLKILWLWKSSGRGTRCGIGKKNGVSSVCPRFFLPVFSRFFRFFVCPRFLSPVFCLKIFAVEKF
jgi:hypothetical protein